MNMARSTLWLFALILVTACRDADVIAEVGDTEVRRSELDLSSRGRPADGSAAALESIIDRAVLAEGAREAGLADDPAVAARLAAAEREILASAYLDRLSADALSEQALRARYEQKRDQLALQQIEVAHIVVRPGSGPDAAVDARRRIQTAYARLRSGEDFAAVAAAVSEDPVTAGRGGQLGTVREGQIDPTFFTAALALKAGQISEPFETSFGWHIAKALADPQKVVPPFAEVRGQLAAEARRETEQAARERLAKQIRVTRHLDKLPSAGATDIDGGGSR